MKKKSNKAISLFKNYWSGGLWNKFVIITIIGVALWMGTMFAIAKWYAYTVKDQPLRYGVSFIPDYASSLGVEPKETMDALINLDIKHFRLVSYWNKYEPENNKYDFTELDWQFKKAEAANAKVTLSLGLRQPRWPECHKPDWAKDMPKDQWYAELNDYIAQVVNRYKDSPALETYQLENEYFLMGFGICTDHSRERLVNEFKLVKSLDKKHPVIISRSNNGLGIPIGDPKPDMYAVSVYKRVWDAKITKDYLEYPMPGWFYGFLAGWQKLNDGRDMVIHELQAEAWAPDYKNLQEISVDEQNKSLNAKRLKERFEYGKATGMRTMDLWGGEYWYYRKVKLNDPSLWNVAKEAYQQDDDR